MPEDISEMNHIETLAGDTEARSRQIVRASPVAMIVSRGPNEAMEVANDKFTKLFGYSSKDIPNVAHW